LGGDAEGEGFVVAALEDFDFVGGKKVEVFEEVKEALILFVDGEDDGGIAGMEFGEENAAVLAKLCDAAADGDSVGTGFAAGETFYEQGFDFGRDSVFEALGFGVGFGPRKADDFGEEHFGELMAKHKALGEAAALGGE
jgi:hypothetical protein